MSHAKQASTKRKRSINAVPVLSIAGLSTSLASGASAAIGRPAADLLTPKTGMSHEITLCEEEISDVSLRTFYIFDKEKGGTFRREFAARGGCGCGGGCGGTPSDIRLKRDIAQVGELDGGINLYRYRYQWSDTTYVGVMAQEVAAVKPEAVLRDADGYLHVDYARLGLRLQTWDQWVAAR
jgi:hypothetical protein